MVRWIRRFVTVAVVGGSGTAVWRYVTARRLHSPAPSTNWPPFDTAKPAQTFVQLEDDRVESPGRTWAEPVDGACPEGFPVKANASSRIFHVPGGRSYERTIPERCYATPEDAAADGFRAAKA